MRVPLFLGALAVLLCAQPAGAQPGAASPYSVSGTYEERLVESINNVRARYGLARLLPVKSLRRSARVHSLQMVQGGFFSHYGADGAYAPDRIARFYPSSGFSYWAAGENLFWAQSLVEPWRVTASWLNSSGHRAVLLSPQWRRLGVGVVRSLPGSGRPALLVTVDFAVRRR